MPDSQMRRAGYIWTFDEHLNNNVVSTLCNYQGGQEIKKK
jgi:hypothetical protein